VLARQGIRFTRAYSDCPVCIPQRTSLVTGIESHRYGMPEYNEGFRVARARGQFLGSLLTSAGYQTQLVGKTHWNTDPFFRAGFEGVLHQRQYRDQVLRMTGRPSLHPTGIGWNKLHAALSPLPPHLYETDWM